MAKSMGKKGTLCGPNSFHAVIVDLSQSDPHNTI
jgi:hypothetical protein